MSPLGPSVPGRPPGQSWVRAQFCSRRWGTKPYCRKPGVLFQGSTLPNRENKFSGCRVSRAPLELRVPGLTKWTEKLLADSGFVGGVAAQGGTTGINPPPSGGGGFKERKDGQPCLSWGAQSLTTGHPPPLSDPCTLHSHLASWGGPGDRRCVNTRVGCGHAGQRMETACRTSAGLLTSPDPARDLCEATCPRHPPASRPSRIHNLGLREARSAAASVARPFIVRLIEGESHVASGQPLAGTGGTQARVWLASTWNL